MTRKPHILLLGGSFEARRMAEALAARGVSYVMWLSEAPRGPASLPQVPLLRRFDDAAQMQADMALGGFTAVLDASHAFERSVTQQGYVSACALGIPYLRLERPPWDVKDQKRWQPASDVRSANMLITPGARVFSATGWDSLPDYDGFCGEVLMMRQTRRHTRPVPYPYVALVFGDPPFDAADEQALFEDLRVDLLICRNLGGGASRPKLDAAVALNLDVILIDRPATPQGIHSVGDIDAALVWIDAL